MLSHNLSVLEMNLNVHLIRSKNIPAEEDLLYSHNELPPTGPNWNYAVSFFVWPGDTEFHVERSQELMREESENLRTSLYAKI